jgi:hypothetical protein
MSIVADTAAREYVVACQVIGKVDRLRQIRQPALIDYARVATH